MLYFDTYNMTREAMRKALKECIEVLRLVEQPQREDPHYGDEVRALGERIGYGALMSSASASWRKKLETHGRAGGEHVAGPCHSSVIMALRMAEKALAEDAP